ncbi:MAG: hypothetical protein AB7H53_19220 [Hyphomicrobium sp.]
MGLLSRRDDAHGDNQNPLGLPDRTVMPRDVRNQRDREMAVETARTQLTLAKMRNLGIAGEAGAFAVANLTRQIEAAAAFVPEERQRIDSIGDSVAAMMVGLINELGQRR